MAIRNIKINDKRSDEELIGRLNDRISGKTNTPRWDNNGPIQFEEQDNENPIKESFCDKYGVHNVYKKDKGPEIVGQMVDLEPRLTKEQKMGGFIDLEEAIENDSIEDARESRAYINKMDTRLRTQKDEETFEDLLWPPESTDKAKEYEEVNHPQHYNNYDVEVIDMMERVFGRSQTATFCKLNAFKYRMRAGTKPGQAVYKDLDKERWYLNKFNELKNKDTEVHDIVGKLQQNGQL